MYLPAPANKIDDSPLTFKVELDGEDEVHYARPIAPGAAKPFPGAYARTTYDPADRAHPECMLVYNGAAHDPETCVYINCDNINCRSGHFHKKTWRKIRSYARVVQTINKDILEAINSLAK
ncbi:uncharacterized protein LOC129238104 [Anastrepha obliqua]|uniref:uncharacterized protein LOC129238104 n=1 Tax=Anastrepha obliqua TaxID=95512 RepID=UPI00240900E2|nr:uncharacterized protein LOC129238104 [Anastrepha obliqua]